MPAASSFTGYITPTTNTSQTTGSTMFYANDVVWGGWNLYYKNQIFQAGGTLTTWNTWNTDSEQQRLDEIAQDQANELLMDLLSDEQLRTWIEQHWFDVVGSESGRTYRIKSGHTNNVDRLSAECMPERRFCAHPPDIPDADVNLAQMLLIATDEPAFLTVANSHPIAGSAWDLHAGR